MVDWNAKVGSQEIPGVIGKFGLRQKEKNVSDSWKATKADKQIK